MHTIGERFCPYCSNYKPDKNFKTIFHFKSMTKRGMCPTCQGKRKLPHSKLIEMAEQDKIDKKANR